MLHNHGWEKQQTLKQQNSNDNQNKNHRKPKRAFLRIVDQIKK